MTYSWRQKENAPELIKTNRTGRGRETIKTDWVEVETETKVFENWHEESVKKNQF